MRNMNTMTGPAHTGSTLGSHTPGGGRQVFTRKVKLGGKVSQLGFRRFQVIFVNFQVIFDNFQVIFVNFQAFDWDVELTSNNKVVKDTSTICITF